MLPRQNRLPVIRLNQLKRIGRRAQSKFFGIVFFKNEFVESSFGIIVSTKVSKKAVVRNRVKRFVREFIRTNLSKISRSYDILILAKSAAAAITYEEISIDLLTVFKESHLI